MKNTIIKITASCFALAFIITLAFNLYSYPTGIVGLTQKNGGDVGCICHGFSVPSSNVNVWITGPDSVATGQTVTYRVYTARGPAVKGGFNVAVQFGRIDTVAVDTSVRREQTDTSASSGELTHKYPKSFANDTVFWTFKYTAPVIPLRDTLFSVGNSTDGNGIADTSDRYNFGPKKIVRVYLPIGIHNQTEIAKVFTLEQNYPNPFNPSTTIEYELKSGSDVELSVYDISGSRVQTLVSSKQIAGRYSVNFDASKLSSGIYFYKLSVRNNTAQDDFILTKKMILLK